MQAQNDLADAYYYGQGVSQDYAKAFQWFERAAEQGYAEAQDNIGCMYYNGTGVETNYEQAFTWFKRAAEQNNASAQTHLAEIKSGQCQVASHMVRIL